MLKTIFFFIHKTFSETVPCRSPDGDEGVGAMPSAFAGSLVLLELAVKSLDAGRLTWHGGPKRRKWSAPAEWLGGG